MFDFLSQSLTSLFSKITGRDRLTDQNIQEVLTSLEQSLIDSDVPYEIAREFIGQVRQDAIGKKVYASLKPAEQFMKIVHDKLLGLLTDQAGEAAFTFQMPATIMMMGLQGSGKTTSIAKLAKLIADAAQKRGKSRTIMLASVDFYRPAAIDQLEILSKQIGARFYRSTSTNPVRAAIDIYQEAQRIGCDLLFLDTAGRMHIDSPLVQELQEIDKALKPKYKLLVMDAMVGQESLSVAREFDKQVGFMGAILTKMDSDTRGGVALAFRASLKKPILYVGTGEKVDDIEQFHPERIAQRIIGMGDMMSLIEKAEAKIKQDEQKMLYESLSQGRLTLMDFAKQMEMMSQLGSLSSIVKYLPGAASLKLSPEMIEKGEVEIKKFKAIIGSMTPKERIYPKLLDASRKRRIAGGAGVAVSDINSLLQRFEQSQQLVKMFNKMDKNPFLRR